MEEGYFTHNKLGCITELNIKQLAIHLYGKSSDSDFGEVNWCEGASVTCTVFRGNCNTCYLCIYAGNYVKCGNNLFDMYEFNLHSQ
jgi:hypothetical protein